MKKRFTRLTALLLALLMLMSMAYAESDASVTKGQYDASLTQMIDDLSLIPVELEEPKITTIKVDTTTLVPTYKEGAVTPESSIAVKANTAPEATNGYQWMIKVGDVWAKIDGATEQTLNLTYAMAKPAMDENGEVQLRCQLIPAVQTYAEGEAEAVYEDDVTVTVNDEVEYTEKAGTMNVEVTQYTENEEPGADYEAAWAFQNAAKTPAVSTYAVARDAGTMTDYTVIIDYVYEKDSAGNSEVAANPWMATLPAGSSYSETITFPTIQGYLPWIDTDDDGTEEQINSFDLNITNIQAGKTYTVTYKPTNVNYTVIHYRQNADNDNYTEYERETLTGLTKSTVPEVAKTYTGFYALLYEKPEIAADGSTVVEIYYDRNYYLMLFELEGGYGVEPVYARYGAEVSVGEPTKAGYDFGGWLNSNGTNVGDSINTTMPAQTTTYTASWTAADSSFTVVYWLENADDEGYSVFGSKAIQATTGTTVNGETYKDYNDGYITTDDNFKAVEDFVEFERADTGVVVAGDKSTVVNVYYTRKEYTLKFYYAMQNTANNNYYVIGGSSYAFGEDGDENVDNSYQNITNYYMDGGSWVGNRGQVDELPTLNANGTARNYTTGYDTDSKRYYGTTYNYRYHYIAFTAKYGADISELWPCDVFNSVTRVDENTHGYWSGTEAFVSAWNGESRVYYSQNAPGGNETIKGNYNQLVTEIMWDYAQFGAYADDNNTIEYMCFWEDGANVHWSVPELYRYQVWVPVLDGEDTTGKTTKEYNGQIYYLRNTYDTVDDSDYDHQTAPAINGLTYVTYDSQDITDFDTNLYKEAYEVNFYYTRNQYELSFQNDGVKEHTETVYFEEDISDKSYEPNYPSSLEPNAYEFDGWYTSSTCAAGTKFNFAGKTMPANNIMLYAKWVPVTHKVEFYLDLNALNANDKLDGYADLEVPHGSKVENVPAKPTNGSYTFEGWFYMEDGKENAFDFANMPVNKDLKVYGKWSSNVLKEYTVYFKIQGTNTEIADPITGSGLAGHTKTFDAKVGDELYAAYQEGYFPLVKSHSMTLDINTPEAVEDGWTEITDADGNKKIVQSFTFWYVQKDAVPYTVYYVAETLKDGGTSLGTIERDGKTYYIIAETYTNSENRKSVVTETFKTVTGYMPDAYQKRLIVDGSDNAVNEIIFYYSVDTTHAYYKITHYTQNTDGVTYTEYASSQAVGLIDQTYSADPITIDGFTYNPYAAGTVVSGVLTADGLELKLYYDRNPYPYEVRYLEQGSGDELADPKTGTGKYGQVISESAIDIENYTPVDPTSQTLTIKIDEIDTETGSPKLNIITFYYVENEVTINYLIVDPAGTLFNNNDASVCGDLSSFTEGSIKVVNGNPAGSTADPNDPTYKFVGWFNNAACTGDPISTELTFKPVKVNGKYEAATYYAKFDWNISTLTITKEGMAEGESAIFTVTAVMEDGPATFTVTVPNEGSVTIHGVIINSEYTVTELDDWTWRYTSTATGASGTIAPGGSTAAFVNEPSNNKWLDDEYGVHNEFNVNGDGTEIQ